MADDLQTARLARTLSRTAIAGRLDEAVGSADWSFQLLPLGERALVCNLSVAGVGRSGVAAVADGLPRFDVTHLADHALAAAAAQFDMKPSGKAVAWVDFDADSGEPLYLPDDDDEDPDATGGTAHSATAASDPGWQRAQAPEPGGVTAGVPGGESVRELVAGPRQAAPLTEGKPAGHEVIERLLDRLREEGLGKEAARLVVTYGGYGRDQAEARELYGKLRALLLSVSPVPNP